MSAIINQDIIAICLRSLAIVREDAMERGSEGEDVSNEWVFSDEYDNIVRALLNADPTSTTDTSNILMMIKLKAGDDINSILLSSLANVGYGEYYFDQSLLLAAGMDAHVAKRGT